MKKSFSELFCPLIAGSVKQKTVESIIDDIAKSEADGARAFTVSIHLMHEEYQSFEYFKRIADATGYPIMAINYKTAGGPDEEHRINVMREAVRAGFRSVDIPMYTFDRDTQSSLSLCKLPFASACPKEVSMRPEVIDKQKKLIKELQDMGAEVLMSAHAGVELSCEQAVSLALEIRSRGADIVKIITGCKSREKQLEILRTNMELKTTLDVPFIYTCSGEHSRFIRFNAPLFGTMLVFANHEYGELAVRQMPLIKDVVTYWSKHLERIDHNYESNAD